MRTEDKPAFCELIQTLATTFRVEVSRDLFSGYWMGLDDLGLEDLEKAVRRATRECEFMPLPAKLRSLAGRSATAPPYHRADLLEAEMERIETCTFHAGLDDVPRKDGGVPWCRKCKRLTAAGKQPPPPKQLPWGES